MKKSIQKVLVVLLAVVMSVTFLVPRSYVKADGKWTEEEKDMFNEFEKWHPTLEELKTNAKPVDLLKTYQVKLKPGDNCYYKFKIHRKGEYRITYQSKDINGYTKCYLFNERNTYREPDGTKKLDPVSEGDYVCNPWGAHYFTKTLSTGEYYIVFRSVNGTGTFNFYIDYHTFPKISCSDMVLMKGKSSRLLIKQSTERPTWSISNSSIATVTAKGGGSAEVKAKKYGTTYVTASMDGKQIKCRVRVVDPKLNKTSLKLKVKKSYQLKVKQGVGTVSWRTSKNSVARVMNGKVIAKKKGTAYITARCNGKTMKCKVIVK